jgi:butyryl-CoA dehydrogenase
MLVDMALNIQAARLLTYQACWEADQAKSYALTALMAKTFATEMTRKVTLQCLQILGGYGYTIEYDAQRYVRDSLVLLNGGTNLELVKNLIGNHLGLS